jgi:magnesium-transporting ATPase (P-type)
MDTSAKLAENMTLISVISLKQPIRDDVKLALARAERGGVNVRIVTNNSPQTAYSQAISAGLIKEKKDDQPSTKKIMLAREFTQECGGLQEKFVNDPDYEQQDDENVPQIKKFYPGDQNKFD